MLSPRGSAALCLLLVQGCAPFSSPRLPHHATPAPAAAGASPPPRSCRCGGAAVMMATPLRVRQRVADGARWGMETLTSWNNFGIDLVGLGRSIGRTDGPTSPVALTEEICLVPGEPVVRVEEAPGNARRIFTGIDIVGDCQDIHEVVWNVLTDYPNLSDPVPNLVSNRVLQTCDGGARLEQVGAAKLAPMITFRATTTLDVREYIEGLPVHMEADHLRDTAAAAAAAPATPPRDSRKQRRLDSRLPLRRDIFPRPYSLSSLAHRDITMQGVEGVGDFEWYQGVWRIQELPGCAPVGQSAMRLTYSVELSPRAWVPVALLEGRIAVRSPPPPAPSRPLPPSCRGCGRETRRARAREPARRRRVTVPTSGRADHTRREPRLSARLRHRRGQRAPLQQASAAAAEEKAVPAGIQLPLSRVGR